MTSTPSVQLYSVRDALAADLPGTLSRLRSIGFELVEPFGVGGGDPAPLADALRAAGLRAPSAHASLVSADDVEPVLAAAEAIGIGIIVEPAVREGWDDPETARATARRLNEVAALAAPRGLHVGYHNHYWEFADGGAAYDAFVAELAPEVVLEVDTYWSTVGGMDTPALLRRLGDRVRLLHVKDGPLGDDPLDQRPVGSGSVPVRDILGAAPHALRVLEFDQYAGDLFEGLAQGLDFLSRNDVSESEGAE
jgi:sugar phosphate isomerase/epimerase